VADVTLKFRSNLNTSSLPHLLDLLHQCRAITPGTTVNIDLSNVHYLFPLSACLHWKMIEEIVVRGCDYHIVEAPHSDSAYRQIRRLILDDPKFVGYGKGKIPTIGIREISDASSNTIGEIVELIERAMGGISTGIRRAVSFPLTELLLNVIQHSETTKGNYVCANALPSKRLIRLCVLDSGIGYLNSLRQNPLYSYLDDDLNAIEKSLEYGVSRFPDQTRGVFLDNLVKLIRHNGGQLDIISGYGHLQIVGTIAPKRVRLRLPYQGTIVSLKLRTTKGYTPLLEEWEEGVESWILPKPLG